MKSKGSITWRRRVTLMVVVVKLCNRLAYEIHVGIAYHS